MKMKYTLTNLVMIAVLLLCILGSGMLSQFLLARDSRKLKTTIDEMLISMESEDWQKAESEIEKLSTEWHSVMKLWSALIDHHEIDNIDVTLSKLKSLIQSKDKSTALSEATVLRKFIVHIPEKEKLSISNIL